ncbi:MAG: type II toxin-antitoxin system mRNA interferase toxin, RelE/StbE family [Candidatus Jacksonbacteria bacterium]|nr:type II toxin-antitoxin system mRNA interferase toxin, RelE/StbE family [Candidatus Jacksonbacteria bacterium]
MMIVFHKKFEKQYAKLSPQLQKAVDDRLILFSGHSAHSQLNDHKLKGKYENYRTINITGDYRAVYKIIGSDRVIFVKIGTHSELYC